MNPPYSNLPPFCDRKTNGFTLLEIMVVVVIIGLLSTLAVVTISHNNQRARVTAFFASLTTFQHQLEQCIMDTGSYNVGSSPGNLSTVFEPYVRSGQWTQETPIGGNWDVDSNTKNGLWVTIGVEGYHVNTKTIQMIDDLFDDGSIHSGLLRSLGHQKYGWIVYE